MMKKEESSVVRSFLASFVWPLFASLLTSILILLSPNALLALGAKPDATGLTRALIAQSIQYQQASRREQAYLLNELIETAASRKELLLSIIEENPAEVIRLAVPASTRAALPPAVQEYIEQEVDIEGKLEVMYEEHENHSRLLYYLETVGERLSLHFADHRPERLLTGARIHVKGTKVANTLALAGGKGKKPVKEVTPAPVPSTLGEQRTLLILVNFQDNPIEPYTAADARSVLFGTTSDFFMENSYQQTWLTGDIYGWYTIPINSAGCNTASIETYAKAAAVAAGADLTSYAHYVYAFPLNYDCGFWGLSTVGGVPSRAWITGDFALGVTAHELGHGLGLFHSHSIDCGVNSLGSSCTAYEYGDNMDMMGSSRGHFNSFQKERLGWLNDGISPPIMTVQTDGTYILNTYETTGLQAKAMKIPKGTEPTTGNQVWYYVEPRFAIGFDGFLADNQNVLNGVLIRYGTESVGNSSYLLDMTPASGSSFYWDWQDPALLMGQDFHDPDSGVTITTDWVAGTMAGVTVQFDQVLKVSTDSQTYTRNQSVKITAKVSGGDTSNAGIPVTFEIIKPNGVMDTATETTGTDGSAVYKMRLRRNDPTGLYQADVAASIGGTTSSASISFIVY